MNEIGEYVQEKISDVCRQYVKETDRLILEYMEKKGLTFDDLNGNIVVKRQNIPWEPDVINTKYWYKDELIFSVDQKYDIKQPLIVKGEAIIEKGDW